MLFAPLSHFNQLDEKLQQLRSQFVMVVYRLIFSMKASILAAEPLSFSNYSSFAGMAVDQSSEQIGSLHVLGRPPLMLPHNLHDLPDLHGDERIMSVLHKDLLALQFVDLLFAFVRQRCFLNVEHVPDVDLVLQNFSRVSADQPFSWLRLHFLNGTHFLAGVLGVEFVGSATNEVEVVAALHQEIHAVVDCNEADALPWEVDLRVLSPPEGIPAPGG